MDRLIAGIARYGVLKPMQFDSLAGWKTDDHLEAFTTFKASCQAILRTSPELRAGLAPPSLLAEICKRVLAAGDPASRDAARLFFEANFRPHRVEPSSGGGFLTGYYEPVVPGSLVKTPEFTEPLLSRPERHVKLDRPSLEHELPAGLSTALKLEDGKLAPYPTRADIDAGALSGLSRPIVWVRDGIEAFMIHVQGSARIALPDGRALRLRYAGRNGHPYTSIGRILVESGKMQVKAMSLESLKAWVRQAGQDAGQEGRALLHRNRSFIFFAADPNIAPDEGPIGGAGVSLRNLRSIAIDRSLWPYGLPFWISADIPWRTDEPQSFKRLMIAQDTGSAILGVARADIFFGSGPEAGRLAGGIRHSGEFTVLLPK